VDIDEGRADSHVSVRGKQRVAQADVPVAVGAGGHVQELLLGRVEHERVLPLWRLPVTRLRQLLEKHGRRRLSQVMDVGHSLEGHIGHEVGAEHEHVAAHLGLGCE
jgi:hypothetical protein